MRKRRRLIYSEICEVPKQILRKECVFAQQSISLDTPASQNVAENQIKGNNARAHYLVARHTDLN